MTLSSQNPKERYQVISIVFQNGREITCVVPAFADWEEAHTWGSCQITIGDPGPLPEDAAEFGAGSHVP